MPNLKVTDDAKLGAATRPRNTKAQELGLKSQQSIQRPSAMLVVGGEISLSKRFKGITLLVKVLYCVQVKSTKKADMHQSCNLHEHMSSPECKKC